MILNDPETSDERLRQCAESRDAGSAPLSIESDSQNGIRQLAELIWDLDNLLRSTEVGTVFLDRRLCIRKFTPRACESLPLLLSNLGRPIGQLAHGLPGIDLDALARGVFESGRVCEKRVRHAGGRWLLMRLLPYRVRDQAIDGVVLTLSDISEVLHAREAVADQAHRDPLTGLFNRLGFEKTLAEEVGRCRRGGHPPMAIAIDCDDFRRVNDGLGHAVGDVVLRDIAGRLSSCLRPHDCIARIGGDEFLVLLPRTRAGEAMQVGERLRLAIGGCALRVGERVLEMTASIGVVGVPLDVVSVEEIISEAHHALSHSKKNGKNRVASADASHEKATANRGVGLADLLLRDGALRVFSQPIHDLAEGRVVGHELLSRGPKGTFESPYDFFRASIENNILTLVDLRCLRNCIGVAQRAPGATGFHLNVLPSTMLDVPKEQLRRLFGDFDDPSRVCIEISEQQFIGDPACLDEHVSWLRDAGFRVAIDDVGFGHSSLESLIVLQPDVIKIDRALVSGLAQDVGKQRSLARLLKVGNCLETEIVAEGVETEADLEHLRSMGVRYAQGFLWERPSEVPPG